MLTQNLRDLGRDIYHSIREAVDAYNVDYDLLRDLEEERDLLKKEHGAAWGNVARHHNDVVDYQGEFPEHEELRRCASELVQWDEENLEELLELREAAGDCGDQDHALQRLEELPYGVSVRSGWDSPSTSLEPAEYRLELAGGGPAAVLRGDLDIHNEPCSVTIYVQDWGTPWIPYPFADEDVLLEFASKFFYG